MTNTSLLVIAAPVTEQAVQPKEIEAKNYLDNTADWVCLKDQTLVDDALTTQDGIVINNRLEVTRNTLHRIKALSLTLQESLFRIVKGRKSTQST